MKYYFEGKESHGTLTAESDTVATEKAKDRVEAFGDELLIVYHEGESDTGIPFVTVWEKYPNSLHC